MLIIAGQPFIAWQLEYLRLQKITSVILCVGYQGHQIERFVGNGSRFGLSVEYSREDGELLGTGGAIKKAMDMLPNNFFVLYGDSYLPIDFSKVEKCYQDSYKNGLMTVFENNNKWDKSNVSYFDGTIMKYDKFNPDLSMNYIDYGLGILNKNIFLSYEKLLKFDLAEVYKDLANKNQLTGYEVSERFYEIGSLPGITEAENYLFNNGNIWNTRKNI
jgi:NDP-sugar pyrophosphorylase family protein